MSHENDREDRLGRALWRGAIHAIESPFVLTAWVVGLMTVAILAIALLDSAPLPGIAALISPHMRDILAWFPGDLIVMAIFVLAIAHGARWIARRFRKVGYAPISQG